MTIQKIEENKKCIVFFIIVRPSYDRMPWRPCGQRAAQTCSSLPTLHRLSALISSVYIRWQIGLVLYLYLFSALRAPYSLPIAEHLVKSQWKQVYISYSVLFNEVIAAWFTSQALISTALPDLLMLSFFAMLTLLLMLFYKQNIKSNSYVCDRCPYQNSSNFFIFSSCINIWPTSDSVKTLMYTLFSTQEVILTKVAFSNFYCLMPLPILY